MKWIVAGLILLLGAFVFNLSALVFSLYVLVAVLLVNLLWTSRGIDQLTAVRRMTETAANVGDMITVEVNVTNNGRWPVAWTMIEDLLAREARPGARGLKLDVSGRFLGVMRLRSGQRHRLQYQLRCLQRGYFQIGPVVAETGDLFGLKRRYRVIGPPDYLLVYPRRIPIPHYEITSRRPIGELVMTHRLFDDPTRIAGIRKYQPGDPLARVHWRATARTAVLHSKLYEPSSIAGATLVVDFCRASYEPQHEPARSELTITAAASLAGALHELGEQFGLVSNGRDAVHRIATEGWQGDWRTRTAVRSAVTMHADSKRIAPVVVPTRRAPEQLIEVLRALARLELTDGLQFPEFIIEAMPKLPRDATVIALVSRVDMRMAVALGQLRRQGYAVMAIVNSPGDERFAQVSAPLLREGIPTRHLRDEQSIHELCRRQLIHQ
jgi:uncharacterized protein (DUF58 family)